MGVDSIEYIGVTAICGDEGTCKTTMALTYPTPIFHMDVDVGGFRRASWMFEPPRRTGMRVKELNAGEDISQIDITQFDIISKPYPRPLQLEKMMGVMSSGTTPSTRVVKVPKKVVGMKELWQSIITDFANICQQPVGTIVVDSNTMFYNVCHQARLQELQEIQEYKWRTDPGTKGQQIPEDEYRERLQPIEYGVAYDRMKAVYHTARGYRRELVLTHYPTDEYGKVPDPRGTGGLVDGKTGNKVMDGYKDTGKLSDLVVWLSIKVTTPPQDPRKPGPPPPPVMEPIAKIHKCGIRGMGLDAKSKNIPASYQGVMNLMNLMRGGQ